MNLHTLLDCGRTVQPPRKRSSLSCHSWKHHTRAIVAETRPEASNLD